MALCIYKEKSCAMIILKESLCRKSKTGSAKGTRTRAKKMEDIATQIRYFDRAISFSALAFPLAIAREFFCRKALPQAPEGSR